MKIKLLHDVAEVGLKGAEISVSQGRGCLLVSTGSASVLIQVEPEEVKAHGDNAPKYHQGQKTPKA